MAKQLSKTGIETGLDIEAHHVTQSVDAFTGIDAYDVTLSGSLTHTGSMDMDGRLIVTSSASPLGQKYYSFTNADGLLEATPFIQRFIFTADGIPNQSFGINNGGTYTQMVASGFNRPDIGESSNVLICPQQIIMASGSSTEIYEGPSGIYGKFPNMKFLQTVDTAGTLPTNNAIQSTGSWEHTGSVTFVNSITGSSPLATLYGPTAAQILSGGEVELKGTDITLDASGDIFLDADGGNIVFKDDGTTRYNFLTDSTPSLSVTGDFTLSGSQDLTFDAAGNNITFRSGSNLRYNFLLDATPTLSVTGGDFTITGSDNITLDADGGGIDLADGGTVVYGFDLVNKDIKLGSVAGNQTISIYGTGTTSITTTGNSIVLQGGQGGVISGNGGGVTIQGGTGTGTGDGGDVTITGGNKLGGFGSKQGDVLIGFSSNTDMIIVSASNDIYFTEDVNVEGSSLWVGPTQGSAAELGVYAVSGEPGGNDSKIAVLAREGGTAPGNGAGRMVLYYTGSSKVANIQAQIAGFNDSFLSGGGLAIGSSYEYASNITSYLLELDTDSAGKPTSNTWTITSDERLKTNIVTASLDICYDGIKNIPLKRFGYAEGFTKEPLYDEHKIGWIAQDVEAVFPKAVTTSSFTTWSTYTGSVPITGSVVGPEGETNTLYPGERYKDPLAGSVVIEDRKSLDSDQLMKMMFGAIQKLQEKVEALEAQISGSN